jgi:hypothetical protein
MRNIITSWVIILLFLLPMAIIVGCQQQPAPPPPPPQPAPAPPTPAPTQALPPTPAPAPAAFTSSGLTIFPTEADIGEDITISVLITNTGDLTGTYELALSIDGVVVDTREVSLAGGASQTVAFTTAQYSAATYTVKIDELSGTFTVGPVGAPGPAPTEPINWGLIGGIIAGCVAIGLMVYFFVWRRRRTPKPSRE